MKIWYTVYDNCAADCELTSAKLIYNGLVRCSDGSIPFITKKEFSMTYRVEVKAGTVCWWLNFNKEKTQ